MTELILRQFPRSAHSRPRHIELDACDITVEGGVGKHPCLMLKKRVLPTEKQCATDHHPLGELLG